MSVLDQAGIGFICGWLRITVLGAQRVTYYCWGRRQANLGKPL